MGYELEIVLRKLEGAFVCVLDGKKETFESTEAFRNSEFEKRCELASIGLEDGKIVLKLKMLPIPNDMNADWVREHIEKYGEEPGFF
jgi:hypothetical protein